MPVRGDVTSDLSSTLDALCVSDAATVADGETLIELYRQHERLSAALTRATAAFDASGAWQDDGARTAAAWVATRTLLPVPTAKRRVRYGRELRHLPHVEAAWLAGKIGEAQVGLLVRARTPATADALARDEEWLVGEAARLVFGSFARLLAYWVQRADPEGSEAEAEKQRDGRRVHLSQTFGGSWVLDGLFDPIGGSIVANELGRIEDELFAADWAEAKQRLGEDVCAADLARTPAQRRADALVEMATRSRVAPAAGRQPEPLFSVIVDWDTFVEQVCELGNGTVVTPGSLRPWLDRAWVERAVFGPEGRVLDIGAQRRFFDGATRRAVQLRDRECFHPYCDVPAEDCEVDHVQPWSEGGPTTQENGRAACAFHNRARERGP